MHHSVAYIFCAQPCYGENVMFLLFFCICFDCNSGHLIQFLGEAGEDEGGLLREFWTIQIKKSHFDCCDCCLPRQDGIALQVMLSVEY